MLSALSGFATLLFLVGNAGAANPNELRLGGDYRFFETGRYQACERACNQDLRCKAWTFIRGTSRRRGQCRLKHTVTRAISRSCCVSGVKTIEIEAPEDRRRCVSFALAAIEDNETNRAERCGLKGARWSDDFATHYQRCLDLASPRRIARETRERGLALDRCVLVAKRSERLTCEHYARMAEAQVRTAADNSCGYSTNLFSAGYDGFYKRCLKLNRGVRRDRMARREAELSRCLSRGGGSVDAACVGYADKAIAFYRRARNERCKLEEAFWHADFDRHYSWCKSASPGQRSARLADYRADLKTCRRRGKGFKFILKF